MTSTSQAPAAHELDAVTDEVDLAVDVHFTPLLVELGASVPVRRLFVLESAVDGSAALAEDRAREQTRALRAPVTPRIRSE